ncbi:hypothetical protein [uncultured Rhizobium sp.]|uniref:hypothetical protein n=1 Tax=unclassified Neorhizobium TaxID=2629175 RepID=UPI002D7E219B|nr:hypothetical protein [uncultured Rhizobium sp.]
MSLEWLGEEPLHLIGRLKALTSDLERIAASKQISFLEAPVKIEEWAITRRAVPCLFGRMVGHPTIQNHSSGITSELFYFDEDLGLARTMNRWYRI